MPYMTTDEESCLTKLKHDKVTIIHPRECNYFQAVTDERVHHIQRYRLRPYDIYIHRPYNIHVHPGHYGNFYVRPPYYHHPNTVHQDGFDFHCVYERQHGFISHHGYEQYYLH